MNTKFLLAIAATFSLLVSSQAAALTTFAMLDSEQVVATPSNDPSGSGGSGMSLGSMTLSRNRLTFSLTWSDLTSRALAVSIHGPATVEENGPVIWFDAWNMEDERNSTDGFTIGVWSGISEAQIDDLLNGRWYMQVATQAYNAGEIRGQIVTTRHFRELAEESNTAPASHLPEPSAAAVFAVGLWVVSGAVRRRGTH